MLKPIVNDIGNCISIENYWCIHELILHFTGEKRRERSQGRHCWWYSWGKEQWWWGGGRWTDCRTTGK